MKNVIGFLLAAAGLALAGHAAEPVPAFHPGDVVLFQGDSITDGNRGRNTDPNHILGHGYAFILAAKAGAAFPERGLTFINRGISGNKVSDLVGRWQNDALNLKPTFLSILIGINDTLAKTPLDVWETNYDKLLADTRAALPGVRILLCEPFALASGSRKDAYPGFAPDVKARQAAVARLAAKYKLPVVHFQRAFDEACKRAPADYWIWDSIHPTYAGHQIMADEWLKTANQAWPK